MILLHDAIVTFIYVQDIKQCLIFLKQIYAYCDFFFLSHFFIEEKDPVQENPIYFFVLKFRNRYFCVMSFNSKKEYGLTFYLFILISNYT